MSTGSADSAELDVTTPDFIRHPYPGYARARRTASLCRILPNQFLGVSRYHDVVRVLHDSKRFSNSGYTASRATQQQNLDIMPPNLVELDPPRHGKLRGLIVRALSPRSVAEFEPWLRKIADGLLESLHGASEFELLSTLAIPLPMIVIVEMLGVGTERRDEFRRWVDDFAAAHAIGSTLKREQLQRSTQAFCHYFSAQLEERRREPREDLLSQLVHAEVDGERVTAEELLSVVTALLIGGNETTTSLIANALVTLTDHPDQLAEVQENPALIPAFIEEVLRFESPAHIVFRQTTTDVELDGVTIPRGAMVLPMLASANRDERQFPDPDRFDIHRDTKGHVAFGLDIHFCPGSALARLEARVMLDALLSRAKNLRRPEREVAWAPSFFLRTPQKLVLCAQIA
ncbi:cytochrome P450 [Chondromyces crocatus]|uniref:Cytochrome P450 n=1 Tax=Chondromyces crocatus TaxID=52 RepID=A0A0K1ECJ1_CHOCO|nr:cytochrome P450 [Chondromyces crocatus]AKT38586.1 cytochrome P450 [Chondromyces crocatus]